MPGITLPQRRRRDDDEDSEEDNRESTPGSQSSKRTRLSPDAESEASEDNSLLPDSYRREPRRPMREEHQVGAIVRIQMKNFVTYSSAEFKCGPSLNMIIGPNGTGKSTLVCAICLGLGWKPNVLGRAKQIGEFVKHGNDQAEIQIELKGGPRQRGRNPVIKLTITRAGNTSKWEIDGRSTTHREVMSLVRKFNIQIDNLCQFLPQDRVVEFSQMSPVQLLESTQKAAAPPEMMEWHEALKKLGADRKKHQVDQESTRDHLLHMQKRQDAQRADVERMEERKILLGKIQALEKCRPGIKYISSKKQFDEIKQEKEVAGRELKDLQDQVEPALRNVNAKKEYKARIQREVQSRKGAVERSETHARQALVKLDDLKKKIQQCDTERTTLKDQFKKKRDDNLKTQQQLTNLKNRLNEEPVAMNTAEINEQIRAKREKIRECESRAREIKETMRDLDAQKRSKEQERKDIHESISNLKSQSGQQMLKLQRLSPDTHRAWHWIQKNQNKFRGEVHGPAILSCSAKDQRYAAALESKVQGGDLLAFTTTSKEDWNTLRQYLSGSGPESLNLKQIHIRNIGNAGMDSWQRPVSDEQLESLGLEAFMIDLLAGPEPVLSMLCDNARLHRTGVSLNESSEHQFEGLQDSPIDNWVAGQQSYRITRRKEYGVSSTSNTSISEARYWTDQGVDLEAERGYQSKLREVEQELESIDEECDSLRSSGKELMSVRQMADAERKAIESEKADQQKARSEWEGLPVKINTLEEKIASFNESRGDYSRRTEAIIAKEEGLLVERSDAALNYATLASVLRKAHAALFEAEIWLIEADSELSVLSEQGSAVREMLKTRESEVAELEIKYRQTRALCKRLLEEFAAAKATLNEEENAFVETWVGGEGTRTIQDLDSEIESTQQRLELLHEGNPRAIEQFESRAKEIEKLTERIANHEEDLAKMTEKITSILEKWEPELDNLVSQISEAFANNMSKIDCAGEISVHKDDDDFKEWSIQIGVKFREHEQMSILDSHRQSGGERAVSTIFYLMALQSLARSPFRVVDEINQGMDPRNERLVHGRMVDIACSENTSQYFLITPKLLNGLKYHERMVVHVIYSGETMPEDNKRLDLGSLADLALRVAGKAT